MYFANPDSNRVQEQSENGQQKKRETEEIL